MRLQKYLANSGVASRRKCEELITQGRVRVNGQIAKLGMSLNEECDIVELDGKAVTRREKTVVIMLNKPCGVISSASDPEGRRTVNDIVKGVGVRVYNVGRLDINSEGLLLMTNDGDLAYRLTHPKHMVEKTYLVLCNGLVTVEEARKLETGILLEDGMTAPAKVERLVHVDDNRSKFFITIHEGKNRQVRRMVSAIGHDTLRLRRIRIGFLTLGTLRTGEWRYLSDIEISKLKEELDS